MRIVIVPLLAVLPIFPSGLSAQTKPPVEVGSRVRVTVPHLGIENQSAFFQTLRSDTLYLFVTQDGGAIISAPLTSVTEFAALRRTSRRTVPGALIGSAVGFSAGVIVLAVAHEGCEGGGFLSWGRRSCGTAPPAAELAPVAGALLGAGIGAVIGYLIKTDRWEEVRLGQLSVQPLVTHDRQLGLAASVRF